MAFYEAYMTPISVLDLHQDGNEVSRRSTKTEEGVAKTQRKKCFFQHFASSWMDTATRYLDAARRQKKT
ncbi:hypothetical protein PHMEG_000461 [Phytophthora megakarya]|uniref:Uncharacterized protein n=1 Tax=Phytophthora megakarya TaxID=4795 RepID=A0A225X5F3_9STRA|nr:hypothetical protein PHMEG_000461 [Phytophthora megakarya]